MTKENLTNEHGRNRTCDTQNRNLVLYPLSYMPFHLASLSIAPLENRVHSLTLG